MRTSLAQFPWPTIGEEIKKEKVTPKGKPALVKPINSGMDEQEQNGVTVPSRAAIEKLHMEQYVEEFIRNASSVDLESPTLTKRDRVIFAKDQVVSTFKKVFPYILVGVGWPRCRGTGPGYACSALAGSSSGCTRL